MISIEGNTAGNVVPHPKSQNWRIIVPTSETVMARKSATGCEPNSWSFFSVKCNRRVVVSTIHERHRALMHESDPDVVLYEEAPFILQWDEDGGVVSIYPSFLVLRVGGLLQVEEVAARALVESSAYSMRIMIEKMILERYGYQFYLVIADDLPKRRRGRGEN